MSPPDTAPADASPELREYLAVLRLRKWTILGLAFFGLVGALLFSFRQTPIFVARSEVLVKPSNPESSVPISSQVSLETEREIALSQQVAEIAGQHITPAESTHDLLGHVSVKVPAETQVLQIFFADASPLRAKQGADAFANAYLDYKTQQEQRALDELRAPIQQQIDDLEGRLRALNDDISKAGGKPTPDQQTQRDNLIAQLTALRTQLTPLNGIVADPGDVLEAADLPASPSSPNHLVNAILGLIVALVIGVGLAFLRERLDDSLKGWNALEAALGAPVLAIVPKVSGWRKSNQARLVTVEEPKGVVSEAYRTLRTSILFSGREQNLRTLLVTSASAGEGKSTTAANLSVVLANAGKKVVLVSADLRKPRLYRFFGIENKIGVVDVVAGDVPLAEALADPGIPNLRVLTSGPIPAHPNELLGSAAMGALLEDLASISDFVVVDTPPVLSVSDALTLAPLADGVLVVADAEATSRGAVAHTRQRLEQVRAPIIGAVLNNFDPSKGRGVAEYYYGYSYRYEYAEQNGGNGRRLRGSGLRGAGRERQPR